jgi:hypothetical protein
MLRWRSTGSLPAYPNVRSFTLMCMGASGVVGASVSIALIVAVCVLLEVGRVSIERLTYDCGAQYDELARTKRLPAP